MGKVHGGLTRAGKVKNQTKKVEKQETTQKKTPCGRAKLRKLYTERTYLHDGNEQSARSYKFNPQN